MAFHTPEQIEYLKIELQQRIDGINKRVSIPVMSNNGSFRAKEVVDAYIRKNTTLRKARENNVIVDH